MRSRVLSLLALGAWLAGAPAAHAAEVNRGDAIQRKMALVEHYINSPAVERIQASGHEAAIALIGEARQKRDQGRSLLGAGDLDGADLAFTEALRAISAASTAAKGRASEPDDAVRQRNEALRAEIRDYRQSFIDGLREKGPAAAGLLDLDRLDGLVREADALTRQRRHADAARYLNDAHHLVVVALTQLRQDETVVHRLDFRTPADEYRYETERHGGLMRIAQQMVTQGAATGPQASMVERFLRHANDLHADARTQAAGGNHERAIKLMEDANREAIRALNAMGLNVPNP